MPRGSSPNPIESPQAAQAFADYISLGAGRTLEALVKRYRDGTEAVPTKRLTTLKNWSRTFHWQERIRDAATARAERMLEEASELDADTFLHTSRKLHRDITNKGDGLETKDVIQIRESVRKPLPKGGASVSVNVSVEIRHLAEQLASELGMNPEELIAEAEQIAQKEWSKAGKAS